MEKIIPVKEFYENTFNLDFLSEEEKETIFKATEMYAKGYHRCMAEPLLNGLALMKQQIAVMTTTTLS